MPYFKDTSNRVHVVSAEYTHLLPLGSIEITEEEVATLTAPTPEQVAAAAQAQADESAKAEAKADNVVQFLRDHTPAECVDYVQANVTDLASAKALMKKFAVVLCVLSKQALR